MVMSVFCLRLFLRMEECCGLRRTTGGAGFMSIWFWWFASKSRHTRQRDMRLKTPLHYSSNWEQTQWQWILMRRFLFSLRVQSYPTREYFAVAEKGNQPDIVVYEYPSLRPYRVLRGAWDDVGTLPLVCHEPSFLLTDDATSTLFPQGAPNVLIALRILTLTGVCWPA